MYHNYDDAENCIRAFFFLGYEAKFAKVSRCRSSRRSHQIPYLTIYQESHNQRLKNLAEPDNTNLYVSNLPRMMVEAVGVSYYMYTLLY